MLTCTDISRFAEIDRRQNNDIDAGGGVFRCVGFVDATGCGNQIFGLTARIAVTVAASSAGAILSSCTMSAPLPAINRASSVVSAL